MIKHMISPERLTEFTADILHKAGLNAEDAKTAAKVLVVTEMRGVRSHGLMRVEKYVRCLLSGGIHAEGQLETILQGPCWTRLDANGSLGLVAGYRAMQITIRKAKQTGIAFATVKNSRHFGAAGYYSLMCAEQGMAGISMSNGDIIMAVTGSNKSSIGNNPFSFAIPAGAFGNIMLDMAMSKYSDGKIQIAHAMGHLLEQDSILDKDGNPSVIPSDYLQGGSLLPFGGHKGYGLAVMVECLAGVLSGSSILNGARAWNTDPDSPEGVGHFFMAINIEAIMPRLEFDKRIEAMIDLLHRAPKKDGVDAILFPGELEMLSEKNAREGNFSLLDSCVESLKRASECVGIKRDEFSTLYY